VRPKTPLTLLSEAVSANASTMGRRSAVIAASSGLVVTMGLPAAGAAPVADAVAPEAPQKASAPAPAPEVAPEVTVPADAKVTFAGSTVTNVTAPPPPPPPPVVEERAASTERVSRSTERTAVEATETVAAPESAKGGSIISVAQRYIGTPYRYGGTTPAGFDCSGFTQYVYRQVGISIPRTSGAQASGGRRVSAAEARPGDLVWNGNGHIGIYAGNGQMIDAPRTGKTVQQRNIWFSNRTFIRY
jgi:cell wall-associated NlpC family hydrolase